MNIDKNDVNVARLFEWKNKFALENEDGLVVGDVYMRLAGDADINRARIFALRESALLRKKLHDPNSDEALALLIDTELAERDKIIQLTLNYEVREATKKAVEQVQLPYPKEPKSNATLEQLEKYQDEIDSYPGRREAKIAEILTAFMEEELARLDKLSDEALFKEYHINAINYICEMIMMQKFREYLVYLCTYVDEDYKEKFFRSFEELDNSRPVVKSQLLDFYSTMEIGGEELKK
jgi:hypothetical protein